MLNFRFGEMSELAEGARLEIVYAPKGYPGFESPSLRHKYYGTQAPRVLLEARVVRKMCAAHVFDTSCATHKLCTWPEC